LFREIVIRKVFDEESFRWTKIVLCL
jgi:hypothetical protein